MSELRDKISDILTSNLGDSYYCSRVWSAWSYGTMTEDDFEEVNESENIDDIVNEILPLIHTPKHETVSEWEKRTGEIYLDDRLVWSWGDLINMWTIITYEKYKEIMDKNFDSSPYIFIHTEQFETQSKEMKNLVNDIKNEDVQNWMNNGHFSLSEEIRKRIQKVKKSGKGFKR